MSGFWIIISDWGYALAAALYTALAIATSRRRYDSLAKAPLVIALSLTALWALTAVIGTSAGNASNISGGIAETMRNAAWLGVLWALLRDSGAKSGRLPRGALPVVLALMLALVTQLVLDLFTVEGAGSMEHMAAILGASWLLRAVFAMGTIILLHGLFTQLAREGVGQIGWLGCALTIMWAFEFNHYVLAWFSDGRVLAVGLMRGVVMVLIAPLIMLGTASGERRRVVLSRRVTYHVATAAIGTLYGLALLGMLMLVRTVDDPATRIVQIGAIFALSVIALVLLPSAAFRAWLRVEIAKHLFAHRYDYREEWMRFADALGTAGDEREMPLRRAVRAVAQAVYAPAALLLLRREDGALAPAAGWDWDEGEGVIDDANVLHRLESTEWIIDVARDAGILDGGLPDWVTVDSRAWVLLPLVHGGRLIGAVLIARPPGRTGLDWEDLDMLRVVGRQLAVTLSERQHQHALAEAQRFDEFNRRFAFILHDIKNMVSQISLLAGNAERHAENPAFRADMVLTLKETADRMNDLISRLARPDQKRGGEGGGCDLAAVARGIAATGLMRGRVVVTADGPLPVRADAEALKQAVSHLVQNAIDATPADGAPVEMILSRADGQARLEIVDQGCGMSADFIANGLFRPFASTKSAGFGLGAHEAQALITAMGGRIDVASRQGHGTRFTISLPLLHEDAASQTHQDRKIG
jgi:putative PEP-CTERM system histidine kinase